MENKNLTICFLGSAATIHTLKWADYFSRKGHNVHLCSYEPVLKGYDLGNIKLHSLKKKIPIDIWPFSSILNLPFLRKTIIELVKEIKTDIVHSHYATSYGSLGVLSDFHPFVLTVWGSDILITPQKFLPSKLSVKYYLKKADLITCDAGHIKEAMIKLGASKSKIKIINFGIDTEKFRPGIFNEKLKEKLRIKNKKVVISLRSLDPIYDIETLIKTASIVVKKYSRVKFIIAGNGPQKEELENLVENLNISDKIIFTGYISNNEIPFYLGVSDIYVSTSLSDAGISSSTAEAMACGLPVVITDNGENRTWVKEGNGGFLIKERNPKVLAEKIIFLLKNEDKGKNFGIENRKTIIKRNDYHNEMSKMEEIYYKLVNKKEL
ncbi:glycosyltransferase family 4 protein [Patescibacteria group bacterium]|nr:glycosyltransferase family 4 protein [Patescibacteria group bacterium]